MHKDPLSDLLDDLLQAFFIGRKPLTHADVLALVRTSKDGKGPDDSLEPVLVISSPYLEIIASEFIPEDQTVWLSPNAVAINADQYLQALKERTL